MEEIVKLKPKYIFFSIIIIALFFYKPHDMNIYWKILISMFLFILSYSFAYNCLIVVENKIKFN